MDSILSLLRTKGYRLTEIRKTIVEIFSTAGQPISAVDIMQEFKLRGLKVNKTTIYREIESLLGADVLKEVSLRDGTKRYEVDSNSHHHHLICLNCKKIQDVDLAADLEKQERRIETEQKFKIQSHSLEFFGLCKDCQNI